MRLKWRTTFPLVLAPVLLLLSATSLSAHSELERCTPAPNTVLKAAPREIRCTFSASLVPDKSMLAVVDASKNPVDNKDSKLDPADEDDMTLVVSLNTSKMATGIFRVQWTVVAEADGDRRRGSGPSRSMSRRARALARPARPPRLPPRQRKPTPLRRMVRRSRIWKPAPRIHPRRLRRTQRRHHRFPRCRPVRRSRTCRQARVAWLRATTMVRN